MPVLNCKIYSCGKNVGGNCHSDEVTISWENWCDNKMVPAENDRSHYAKTLEDENSFLKDEIRDLEMNADSLISDWDDVYDDMKNLLNKIDTFR